MCKVFQVSIEIYKDQEVKSMQANEIKEYVKAFKKKTRDISKSKESASSYLIKAGINSQSGRLTENYSPKK